MITKAPWVGPRAGITGNLGRAFGLVVLSAMLLSIGSAAAAGPRDRKSGGSGDSRVDLARRFARVRQLAASGPVGKAESAAGRLAELIRRKLGSGAHPYLAAVRLHARILSRGKKAAHIEKAKKLYREVYRLERRRLGPAHPSVASTLIRLSGLHLRSKRLADGWRAVTAAFRIQLANAARHLPHMSLRARQRYLESIASTYHLLLDLLVLRARENRMRAWARSALELIMAYKGMVMASVQAQQDVAASSRRPQFMKLWNGVRMARRRLNHAVLRGPASGQAWNAYHREIQRHRQRLEAAERRFARTTSPYMPSGRLYPVKFRMVRNTLTRRGALVEYVKFRKISFRSGRVQGGKWHYAAVALRGGRGSNVGVQYLGPAAKVEALVRDYLRSMERGGHGGKGAAKSRSLARLALGNLMARFPVVFHKRLKRVTIAPAGVLHSVAFHALPVDSAKTAGDRWTVVRVGSGRDVLAAHRPSSNGRTKGKRTVAVVAPALGRGGPWKPTHFTPGQVSTLKTLLGSIRAGRVHVLAGRRASDDALHRLNGPTILHVHAPGFRYTDGRTAVRVVWKRRGLSRMARRGFARELFSAPWRRSGMALAGANGRLRRAARPFEEPRGDGLLTAEEMASLNLMGTQLAVLSGGTATWNRGSTAPGQAPLDLARAAQMAGARTVVASLWNVPARSAWAFLSAFYRHLKAGRSKFSAYRLALTEARRRRPQPRHWAGWILLGHPGSLR